MVSVLHSFRVRLESRSRGSPHVIAIAIAAFTAMGLLLAVLHGIEAAFWAAAYLWLGALDSPAAATLYSIDTMATRGGSGLMLQPHWQLMGALEAADGPCAGGLPRRNRAGLVDPARLRLAPDGRVPELRANPASRSGTLVRNRSSDISIMTHLLLFGFLAGCTGIGDFSTQVLSTR
jgi:hypothetical protein